MFILDIMLYKYAYYLIYGFLAVGVASFFLSKYAGIYDFVTRIISLVIICCSLFILGTMQASKKYAEEIARYKQQIELAEKESRETNVVIQTRVVEKIKYVRENTNANIQYIDRVVTQYDNLCTLSNSAIRVHNSASQNEVSRSAGNSDEGTSNVKASELIRTVTENYGTYYEVREQLLGWQQWYREQRRIHESVR
jgi:ABC-type Na+ efflux pump permease subunit